MGSSRHAGSGGRPSDEGTGRRSPCRSGGSTATVEAGGRFFLNNPQRNGSAYLGQKSLAKFYEYRDLRPGPFGNFWLATGTSDGLYQIDVGGKNVGYRRPELLSRRVEGR